MKTNLEQNYANRYQILQEIGRGGIGCVYKAYDKQKNIEVALKILLEGNKAQEKQKKRFLREAQAINNLNHKNIIRIYDVFTQPQLVENPSEV
ncbi:protein kinase [Candidatus Uabimicrobium sp. HlEnr_7]|uniref:protein kinase domain-containing protein n=1 Tax=Candidatus Uabimicrobium helgolandensis TaxID=3095367 RepID=UPI0035575D53